MTSLRLLCGLVCFLVLASNVWSMSRWSEARGVYDDVCYLRQAHLFQRFGLGGFDTDITRDDDHYLASKLKEIGFPTWNDPATAPCHPPMAASGKRVIQYPPGTGLVLALFPQGHQVIPLYVTASVILFGFVLLAIFTARTPASILLEAPDDIDRDMIPARDMAVEEQPVQVRFVHKLDAALLDEFTAQRLQKRLARLDPSAGQVPA